MKRAFDPDNRLNPGKVVGAADPGDHLRIGPDYHPREPAETVLDFSGQGGFARAVEMCSGVGACRKTGTGTMCPSYMVTRDEMHSTRGRANALRLVMTGDLPSNGDGLANETLFEALDLCLQCKACKSECPSKVDMAKLKAEFLHQYYGGGPRPLGHLLMGQIFRLNPIGSALAPLANATLRQPAVQVAPGEDRGDRPPADPADVRPRPLPELVPTATRSIPARAGAGRSSCSTTASRPTTTPRSASRRSGCWRRPATGSAWPACAAAAGRRSPRGS